MKHLLIFFSLFCFFAQGQDDQFLKKIGVQNKKTWTLRDSSLINRLNKTALDSSTANPQKGQKYSKLAYQASKKIEYSEGKISSLNNLIRCKINSNEYDSAIIFANQVLSELPRTKNTKLIVQTHEAVGSAYDYSGKYDQAVKNYLSAIGAASKVDSSLALISYHNIGLIYRRLNNIEKAYEYLTLCETISRKSNNLRTLTSTLNNLGIIKKTEKKYDEALSYYEEGLAIAKETGEQKLEADILSNMSTVFFEQGDSNKGMRYFERSMEWSKKSNSYYELTMSYNNFAWNLLELNQLPQAEIMADKAVKYSKLSKNPEFIVDCYLIASDIKFKCGKHAEAYADLQMALNYKDSMNYLAMSSEISDLEAAFKRKKTAIADSLEKEQLKKEFAVNQQLTNEKLRSRNLLLVISLFILVLVAIGAFLLYKSNRKVIAKNKIVEEQHKEITDSINYAQRIQSAMISNDEAWQQISPHRSIFFKPKDVVSGDFHWAHFNIEKNLAIWSVADCTGHGVPGAFMSVLGSSFLTDIIVDDGETDPAKILDLLRKKVISSLMKKGEDQPKDGMDLGLCVWEKDTNTLHFAGANNPLYVLRRRENATEHKFTRFIDIPEQRHVLLEVPPNKMPIGSFSGNESPFKATSLKLFSGDTLILSTDGYADQFGGEHGKKLKSRPFKEFLLGIQSKSVSEQSELIETFFADWMGSEEQLDDVCVVGIRIS